MRTRLRHCALLLLAALILAGPAFGKDLVCSVCHQRITGKYLTAANGRVFCSQACYETTLPKCAKCGRTISGKFYDYEGKKYCSEECLSVLWPSCALCGKKTQAWSEIEGQKFCKACAAKPRCAECGLPFEKGVELPDKRALCAACQPRVLSEPEAVATLAAEARAALLKLTGEQTDIVPELKLAMLPELMALTDTKVVQGPIRSQLRGFFHRQETVRTGGEPEDKPDHELAKTVYLLNYMLPENVLVTAVHEETHDLMLDHYPATRQAPAWVQEGLAQFAAAQVARGRHFTRQLQAIEKSPDPAYGDGYRFFRDTFGADDWPAVAKWLRATDLSALPANPPAVPAATPADPGK